MSDIILHHYQTSPYSEKVRNILGFKGLSWKSVITPFVLPKPELMPLTGGYRRAPIMQIGRDVILDTALMARVLDRLHPTPALIPPALKASCAAFVNLEQTLFYGGVSTVFQPEGLKAMIERMGQEQMQQFAADRQALFVGGTAQRPGPEYSKTHFLPLLNAMDAQLSAQAFLLGEVPTLADFVSYHPVWFVLSNKGVAPQLAAFKNLLAWVERIKALGHGSADELSAEGALAISRSSSGQLEFDGPVLEPQGAKLGTMVTLQATDYGCDPVQGMLVHASVFELVVKRSDPRAGEVLVHAPRNGYSVKPV